MSDHGAIVFQDRQDAGRRLGTVLRAHTDEAAVSGGNVSGGNVVVVGLPRGGVVVAAEVAAALDAPLDVLVVRKIGTPGHEELAMGAVAEGGVTVIDDRIVTELGITPSQLAAATAKAERELTERARLLRGVRPMLDLAGATVVLVDDGLATGSTARAALRAVAARGAGRRVMAVPVGAPAAVRMLASEADEVVCLAAPAGFRAVGAFYVDFRPITDTEVQRLLADVHP